MLGKPEAPKHNPHGQGAFFCCGPFLLVPRVIGFWKIFCCRPRVCAKCFFCCAPLGAATFRRGQARAKKKHHPGCFFFCSVPGERQGKEKPRAGTGPEQKHHPGCVFFCCGPGERQRKEKPRWAPARGQSKKQNTTQVVFFLLRPRKKAGEGEAPLGAGTGPKQKKNTTQVFLFFRQ